MLGSRAGLDVFGEMKNILPLPKFELRIVQSVRYIKLNYIYIRGPHIFHKSRDHINIPGVRRVIWSKLHSGPAQILGPMVQKLNFWATWDVCTPDICNPWYIHALYITYNYWTLFYYQLMHATLKNAELLKHSKLDKNAPTCFGLHRNHLQGAKVSAWLKIG